MADGQDSDDTFTVKVQLEDSNGNLTAFSGEYRLLDESGNTIDSNGNVQNDTFRLSTSNGRITLKAGWSLSLIHIYLALRVMLPDFLRYVGESGARAVGVLQVLRRRTVDPDPHGYDQKRTDGEHAEE